MHIAACRQAMRDFSKIVQICNARALDRHEVCVRRPKAVFPKHTSNSDSRSLPLLYRVCSTSAWLWRVRLSDPRLTQPSRKVLLITYSSVESLQYGKLPSAVVHHANAKPLRWQSKLLLVFIRHPSVSRWPYRLAGRKEDRQESIAL